jgi:hypothetical protein
MIDANRSSAMSDTGRLRRLAELQRLGDGWYIAKRTAVVTMTVESALMLWSLGEEVSFLAFFFCGILSVVAGAIAASHDAANLRRRFGEAEEV